jgi:hypothetical protein
MSKNETAAATGFLTWELFGADGELKASGCAGNLITQVGTQMYWERGAGVSGAPAVPTGMKLGTGTAAVTATGSGAALATYLSNSDQAFDSSFPTSSLLASAALSGGTAVAATDTFTFTGHGLVDGRSLTLTTPPAGLTAGVVYYVLNSTTNTFQLSATPGGSVIDVTADGAGISLSAKATRRIAYKTTYAAGKATSATAIAEAVIVNETLTDATSAAAATVARILLGSQAASKGSADTLALTWNHDLAQN